MGLLASTERGSAFPLLRTRDGRIWLFAVCLAVFGAALYIGVASKWSALHPTLQAPFWVFAIAFGLAEVCVVHIQLRRQRYSTSLSEIPLVLALFFASP